MPDTSKNWYVLRAISGKESKVKEYIDHIGGLSVSFGEVTLTTIACALILGILANLMLGIKDKKKDKE